MKDFDALIGEWHGEGEIPIEPPMMVSVEATIERLGDFIVSLGGRACGDAKHPLDHRWRTRG
jgi:hypothetical protein